MIRALSLVVSGLVCVVVADAIAQAPDTLDFQGRLTNSAGVPVDSSNVSMTFKLYKDNVEVWTETHSVNIVEGVFNVPLGKNSPLGGIAFNDKMSLGIKLANEAQEMSPRTPLTAAAFALGMRGQWAVDVEAGNVKAVNLVGGASNNFVGSNVAGATIGGGGGYFFGSLPDSVMANWGTVSGGGGNKASGEYSTVGGGLNNKSTADYATAAGGRSNQAGNLYSTVGGGSGNEATGQYSTIGGGWTNAASAFYASVSGGAANKALGDYSHVGGGYGNETSSSGAIGGGYENRATASGSSVIGGYQNFATAVGSSALGGTSNRATGESSTVGGGYENRATGTYAVVPGGYRNQARGMHSFAAGRRAVAKHNGTFVWNDASVVSLNDSLVSTANNQFIVRAVSGIGFNAAPTNFGIHLKQQGSASNYGIRSEYPNDTDRWDTWIDAAKDYNFAFNGNLKAWILDTDGSYQMSSDARLKEDIVPYRSVLDRVGELRPSTYRFKDSGPTSPRSIGLVAQEVEPLFPELVSEKEGIKGMNYDGLSVVAIKAIQELHEIVRAQQAEIEALRAEVTRR